MSYPRAFAKCSTVAVSSFSFAAHRPARQIDQFCNAQTRAPAPKRWNTFRMTNRSWHA